MGKTAKRLEPTITHDLKPERTTCLDCGRHLRAEYVNRRTVATLTGVTRLNLTISLWSATSATGSTAPSPRSTPTWSAAG